MNEDKQEQYNCHTTNHVSFITGRSSVQFLAVAATKPVASYRYIKGIQGLTQEIIAIKLYSLYTRNNFLLARSLYTHFHKQDSTTNDF